MRLAYTLMLAVWFRLVLIVFVAPIVALSYLFNPRRPELIKELSDIALSMKFTAMRSFIDKGYSDAEVKRALEWF